jgi:hypothetical protein
LVKSLHYRGGAGIAKQKPAGEEAPLILGYEVYNSEGEKIGQVEETYHGVTGLVEWMVVRGDGSAGRRVFLPLKTAQIQDGKVYIPYSKEEVMTAPEPEDGGHIPEEAERWLYAHQESQAPDNPTSPRKCTDSSRGRGLGRDIIQSNLMVYAQVSTSSIRATSFSSLYHIEGVEIFF